MDLNQFGLNPLSVSDKPFIDSILNSAETGLSSYSFTAHYIWRDIFQYYWGTIEDYFCLFAQYSDYICMPVPPVLYRVSGEDVIAGEARQSDKTLSYVFSLMNKINKNHAVSRIENIDECQRENFVSIGYDVQEGEAEYVYLREDLVNLKGNDYKSKRAMYNYFLKNYQYRYESFQPSYAGACIRLYEEWKLKRGKKFKDPLYHALLEDSSYSHKQAVNNYEVLSLTGRVVWINGRIEGYIFGFDRGDIFYIMMEITNPEIKGLSQFIFREFCKEAEGVKFINTLGDSGLQNLRDVKLSYRPFKIVSAYIAFAKT